MGALPHELFADISLTLVNFQLDAQISYLFIYNTFIKILYMFRERTFFLNRCTGQSPADSDDTRGCIYIQLRRRPPEDKQGNARNM